MNRLISFACGGFLCNRSNSSTRQDMSSYCLHQPAWAQWTCIGFWRSWKLCYGLCSAKKLTRFSIWNPHCCGRSRDFYLQFICTDHLRSAGLSLSSNGTLFINWFCSWQSSVWRMKLSWISRDCSWLMLMLLHPSCNKMTVPKQTLSFNQPFSPSTWNTCFFTRWLATPNLTLQPFLPLFAIQPLEHVWLFYSLSKGFSSKIT